MVKNHTISLDDESEEIWKVNFGPEASNRKDFSRWIQDKLKEIEPDRYNLSALKKKRDDLIEEYNSISEKLEDLNKKINALTKIKEVPNE